MLGHTYRYQVYNGTGVSVTVTLKARSYQGEGSGRTDAAEVTHISAAATAAGAYANGSTQSATKDTGAHITFTFAPASSATGRVQVYLQTSTDGGTTWPDNGKGLPVASHYFSASSSTIVKNAEV